MANPLRRELLRALLEIARADGTWDASETEVIAGILVRWGFAREEILDAPKPGVPRNTPRLSELLSTKQERLAAMRDILEVAHADGVLAGAELRYIERLAEEMEISLPELVELNEQLLG